MKGTWKTVKQAGLSAGARTKAKTASGNVVEAVLIRPGSRGQRWDATNQATGREVQITKVFVQVEPQEDERQPSDRSETALTDGEMATLDPADLPDRWD